MNLHEMQATVSTAGWKDMVEAIQQRRTLALEQLADPGRPTENAPNDDTLRGYASFAQWVLQFPKRISEALKALEEPTPPPEPEPVGSIHAPEPETPSEGS